MLDCSQLSGIQVEKEFFCFSHQGIALSVSPISQTQFQAEELENVFKGWMERSPFKVAVMESRHFCRRKIDV